MSLKDDIPKIIQSKFQAINDQRRHHTDFLTHQADRFHPMKTVLAEMVKAFGTEHLNVCWYDASATIEIGTVEEDTGYLKTDFWWKISPDYEIKYNEAHEATLYGEQGIKTEETHHLSDQAARRNFSEMPGVMPTVPASRS